MKNNIYIHYVGFDKLKNKLHKICYKKFGANCLKYEILFLCNYLLPKFIISSVSCFIKSLFTKIEKNV